MNLTLECYVTSVMLPVMLPVYKALVRPLSINGSIKVPKIGHCYFVLPYVLKTAINLRVIMCYEYES